MGKTYEVYEFKSLLAPTNAPGRWDFKRVDGDVPRRASGPDYYEALTVFTSRVQPGDWFMDDMRLGPVLASIEVKVTVNGAPAVGYKIRTKFGDWDIWSSQQLRVLRLLPKPVEVGPAASEAVEMTKADPEELVYELALTESEAHALFQVFRSHLAGPALYNEGSPLNSIYRRVIDWPFRLSKATMFNSNKLKGGNHRFNGANCYPRSYAVLALDDNND